MGETLVMTGQMVTIEDIIESSTKDLEKKITDIITDKEIAAILEGGKRLRPLLAHLVFKACTQGKETPIQYQRALEGGVVIELAHAASLVHACHLIGWRPRRVRLIEKKASKKESEVDGVS